MEEISSGNRAELEKKYRATAIIIVSQIILAVVLTILALLIAPNSADSISQQTLTTLWVAMIFIAIGAFVLRRMFFRWDRLNDIALLGGVLGVLRTLQINAIILGALAEAIAIVGFVITILSGAKFETLRAAVVALIVFLINFPRKSVWEKIVESLQKV
ncbi:MAG: hypothetical protein ACR2HG_07335 [Pyrinomonadaceae bacterium]